MREQPYHLCCSYCIILYFVFCIIDAATINLQSPHRWTSSLVYSDSVILVHSTYHQASTSDVKLKVQVSWEWNALENPDDGVHGMQNRQLWQSRRRYDFETWILRIHGHYGTYNIWMRKNAVRLNRRHDTDVTCDKRRLHTSRQMFIRL